MGHIPEFNNILLLARNSLGELNLKSVGFPPSNRLNHYRKINLTVIHEHPPFSLISFSLFL